MHAGKIVAMGSPQVLKETYGKKSIEEVFIHLVKSEMET